MKRLLVRSLNFVLAGFGLAMLTIQFAAADCAVPTSVPAVPNGATATGEEMIAAHNELQSYVSKLEDYQACIEQKISDAPIVVQQDVKDAWRQSANNAVDAAHILAGSYSTQLKIFKLHNPNATGSKVSGQ